MITPRRIGVLTAALVVALASTPAATAGEPPLDIDPGYGVIRGHISNPGARQTVIAERVDAPGARTRADSIVDGDYEIRVRVGEYRVTFVSETQAWEMYPNTRTTSKAKSVMVESRRATAGVDADLEPSGTISGRVIFPAGTNPQYSNAGVVPYYLDGTTWRPVPQEDSQEARPTYTLVGLPSGTYRLKYGSGNGFGGTASGFLGGTDDAASGTPVVVSAGQDTSVDVSPRLGGSLTGRVVDSEGRGVPDVVVQATQRLPGDWNRWPQVTTDSSGRYTIKPLDTGDYFLSFGPPAPFQSMYSGGVFYDYTRPYRSSSEPHGDATFVQVQAAATTSWSDETVRRPGAVEGTMRDGDGNPLEGIRVELTPGGGYVTNNALNWDRPPLVRTTDANGHYEFSELGRGPYRTRFYDPEGAYNESYYLNEAWHSEHGATDYWQAIFVEPETRHVVDSVLPAKSPNISDITPVVGQELRASLPSAGAWTWRRNGAVIAGADEATYRPTTADRGARLTVETATSRRGSSVRHVRTTSAVSVSRPTVTISPQALGHGKVRLTIRASAPGVSASLVDGKIDLDRVRRGSDHMAVRTIRDGTLVLTLTGQPRGKQTYKVRFLAVKDRYSTSATVSRAVTVR